MADVDYAEVQRLFQQLRRLPPQDRTDELAALAARDAAVHDEVAELLRHHDAATDGRRDTAGLAAAVGSGAQPQRIAEYEVEGLIGEGGMGVVYRAIQPDPRRTVAIKVVRAGLRPR